MISTLSNEISVIDDDSDRIEIAHAWFDRRKETNRDRCDSRIRRLVKYPRKFESACLRLLLQNYSAVGNTRSRVKV